MKISKMIENTLITIAFLVFTFLISLIFLNYYESVKVVTPKIQENPLCNKIFTFIESSNKRIPSTMVQTITDAIILTVEPAEIPLVVGIIFVESNFNPTLVSSKNARGLMQVRWSVWKQPLHDKLGILDQFELHEATIGIQAGLLVLHTYMKRGDLTKALYLYSGKSTQYPCKVLKSMVKFQTYKGRSIK